MIVICIYHGGVVKPFDCSHFALSSCDGAHSDTCAFLHKEIGPMARSVNKSASLSLLCFFLGGFLWRGYNIRNLLRRSFRYQAFRLAQAPGERKTRFEESELHAWQWLMQWGDRPPLEQVPAPFLGLATSWSELDHCPVSQVGGPEAQTKSCLPTHSNISRKGSGQSTESCEGQETITAQTRGLARWPCWCFELQLL